MRTEHLHQTLSPRAHAALFDALQRQAESERRAAVQRFGLAGIVQLSARVRRLASHGAGTAPAVCPMEG